jgi:type VI protein secretion system component VasF
MAGQVVFFGASLAGAGAIGWRLREAARHGDARKVAPWHIASLLAYILLSLWLGFGWGGQALACLAAVVLEAPAVHRPRGLRRA